MRVESQTQDNESHKLQEFLAKGDRFYQRYLDPSESGAWLEESLNEYARALELAPGSTEILLKVARVNFKLGHFEKAERVAIRVYDAVQKPSCKQDKVILRQILPLLAAIVLQRGHAREAMGYVKQAALSAGSFLSGRLWHTAYEALGSLGNETGGISKALYSVKSVACLGLALLTYPFETERPSFSTLLHAIPALLVSNGYTALGYQDTAMEHLLQLQKRYPGMLVVGLSLARLSRMRGDLPKSGFWLEKTIKRHPGALDAHLMLGCLFDQMDNLDEASEIYGELLEIRPQNPSLHTLQGHILCELEQFRDAIWHYETALQQEKAPGRRASLAQNLGRLYGDVLQNPEAAIMAYQMAVTLDPSCLENYIQLGMQYYQKEDYTSAERIYKAAINVDAGNPRLYSNLGYLRWMENDIEEAIRYYQKAIEMDPNYEIPLNNLGVIYLDATGQVGKAIGCFERAIAVNDQYALAHYNLGRAHSFQNRRLDAAMSFQKAQQCNLVTNELDSEDLDARIFDLFQPVRRDVVNG